MQKNCEWCKSDFEAACSKVKTCCRKHGYLLRDQGAANIAKPISGEPSSRLSESGDERTQDAVLSTEVKTLDELVAACDIDTEIWDIERWTCGKWDFAIKDASTQEMVVRQMFKVRATMRRKVAVMKARDEIERLAANSSKQFAAPPKYKTRRKPKGCLYEESIYDPHFGKLAWGEETGHPPYDLDIAIKLYREASETLLSRVAGYDVARIMVPCGNDMFHIDDRDGATHRGTAMDYDSRFEKIFQRGCDAVIENIYRLSAVAPVDVVMVRGNHDTMAAWHLGHALGLVFQGHKHVTVDNSPKPRKYYKFGRCGFMLTHGDKASRRAGSGYSALFASEQPEMWASTTYREAHIGHFHREQVVQDVGFTVRTLPALCQPDAWHSENGFVGNPPTAMGMIWHPEEGRVATVEWRPLAG